MNWELATKILLAALAVAGGAIELSRRAGDSGARSRVRQDLEIWKLLPDESAARKRLLNSIDERLLARVGQDSTRRRDPAGIALGIVFILIAIILFYFAFANAGWWYLLALIATLIGLLGAVGFAQDVVPRERDQKGRPATDGSVELKDESRSSRAKAPSGEE